MNPSSDRLADNLLELFRLYSAETVYGLVESILVSWGYELVRVGKLQDPRDPAIGFWHSLTYKDFDEPYNRSAGGSATLDRDQIFTEAEKWGVRLSLLPFEETIETFTSAVLEWLRSCDFGCSSPVDEKNKMLDFYQWWGASLGVD